ncbi:hypothetical protein B0H17DRAFT_1217504 [Mycena rosella]|uniref:Origin recognition complex subunit 3 winged helix C-terminal domain-containing protein n=1 Tax=Mycena rosella TaxID=1033263 RepID=A0AAD7BXZ2_MYCRO|nr:hypothetical protein B0H17DRAFT_1217504 [Mycena rosella]
MSTLAASTFHTRLAPSSRTPDSRVRTHRSLEWRAFPEPAFEPDPVLSLSTPSPSSYLQASLTRSTLSLLRVCHFVAPKSSMPSSSKYTPFSVLHPKLTINTPQTFFDPAVELLLLPGPTLLEFIEAHYATHTPSLDALLSILQHRLILAPLSHHPAHRPASSACELRFLEALLARLHALTSKTTANADTWHARHSRGTKLGFRLLHIVIAFLRARAATDKLLERWRSAAAVSRALDGDGASGLATVLRKLTPAALEALLGELNVCLHGLPHAIRVAETQARSTLVRFRNPSSEERDEVAGWEEEEEEENLQNLPDTSILLKRYTKTGKVINVYDWFDNFRIVFKGQLESALSTPAKGNGKGKGKDKKEKADAEGDEKWKLGVQAQFMSSLCARCTSSIIWALSTYEPRRRGEEGRYILRTVLGALDYSKV